MPATLPGGLDDVIELVLPEGRRRGLFRQDYEGRTLRAHLGSRSPRFGCGVPARCPIVPADAAPRPNRPEGAIPTR